MILSPADGVLRTIGRVARALDAVGVEWAIGGSIASFSKRTGLGDGSGPSSGRRVVVYGDKIGV